VFAEEGNIFIYDHTKGERHQLIKTTDPKSNPHFTFDQKSIYFTRQNNLYVMSLDGGSLEQLTDIRTTTAGANTAQQGAAGGASQGARQSEGRSRLMIIDVESGETRNVDHGQRQVTSQTIEQAQRDTTESATTAESQRAACAWSRS
jgi:Tol biopolymer transport system component